MQSVKLFFSYLNQNWSRKDSPAAKKHSLESVKSHLKRSEIYRSSRSITQNLICWLTMVAKSIEDFEPPSKIS